MVSGPCLFGVRHRVLPRVAQAPVAALTAVGADPTHSRQAFKAGAQGVRDAEPGMGKLARNPRTMTHGVGRSRAYCEERSRAQKLT